MNISCEVIKDLLPLYHDGVCSDESKALVEEHLAHCVNCSAELQAMDTVLLPKKAEINLNEAEAVKKLSKRWKRGMWKSLLKGIFLAIGAVAIVFLVLYLFMDFRFM